MRVPRRAAKQLAALPAGVRERVVQRIDRLCDWPEHGQDVKPLKGRLAACYRLRCGEYRVLFQVLSEPRAILIERVGVRESVYD